MTNLQQILQFNNCYIHIVYQVKIYNKCLKCPLQSHMGTSDHGMLQLFKRPGAFANGFDRQKKGVGERSVRFKLQLNTITGLNVPTDENVEDWGQANVGAVEN